VRPRQIQHGSDIAHSVIVWNGLIEAKRIEQLPLIVVEPPHRQPPLPRRLLCGESRFAAHSNRLLQQNLPETDHTIRSHLARASGLMIS
jgi:hypothetical protein